LYGRQHIREMRGLGYDASSVRHIWELVANVPSYRRSLGNLTEAKINEAYEPVRRHRRP
jgi:hypothetical protein